MGVDRREELEAFHRPEVRALTYQLLRYIAAQARGSAIDHRTVRAALRSAAAITVRVSRGKQGDAAWRAIRLHLRAVDDLMKADVNIRKGFEYGEADGSAPGPAGG